MATLQIPPQIVTNASLQLLVPQLLCFAFHKRDRTPQKLLNGTAVSQKELLDKEQTISRLEKELLRSRAKAKELNKRTTELNERLDVATEQIQNMQLQLYQLRESSGKNLQRLQEQKFERQANYSNCSVELVEGAARLHEAREECQVELHNTNEVLNNITVEHQNTKEMLNNTTVELHNTNEMLKNTTVELHNTNEVLNNTTVKLDICRFEVQDQINFTHELADVLIPDKETIMAMATTTGNVTVIQLLLRLGSVNLSQPDGYGFKPLEWASIKGQVDIAKLLLDGGADPGSLTKVNDTALHWAARTGHSEFVRLLLSLGADLEARNKYGSTALHEAAYYGHLEACTLLVNKGAQVNVRNNAGSTPLDFAASAGNADVVELLVRRGADRDTANGKGRTPLEEARKKGRQNVVWWLENN